jgi:oligopeptide/dipeptide ABC transporter ATP-binding protein
LTGDLLNIKNLRTYFYTSMGIVRAVDGVSFDVKKGEVLGLVGESACGKSVTGFSIMRLVPSPPGKIISGEIIFDGHNLLALSDKEMQRIRGARISMSFQDPMTYLNPVFRVGDQIAEAVMLHQNLDKKEAMEVAIETMKMVQIPKASERVMHYPHQFSGGMRQRVLLAIAICCNPLLLIADEPTTALDVIIQSEVLELIKDLKKRLGLSILLITHDLGIISDFADKIVIMYAGNIIESGETRSVFSEPKHPYTSGLLKSLPSIDMKGDKLVSISGMVPNPIHPPSGCKFHPRCPFVKEICKNERPLLQEVEKGHLSSCIRLAEISEELKVFG